MFHLCKFHRGPCSQSPFSEHAGKDALLKVFHLTKEKKQKMFTLAFIFHLYECVCKKKKDCFSSQSYSDIGGKCS